MVISYRRRLNLIEKQLRSINAPYISRISQKKDPFKILVSCILSLRTKDEVTEKASRNLFKRIKNPSDLLKYKKREIEKMIYPVGFYKRKAKILQEIARKIVTHYHQRVPPKEEDLLAFKGVGRKTANLVLGLGFGMPAICVDTHVHRISNRLGWVKTQYPHQTEDKLKRIIPRSLWVKLNTILVAFGRNICVPVSPWCSKCWINKYCKKRGVRRNR